MQIVNPYRFTALVLTPNGDPLGEVPLQPEWHHGFLGAGFTGARRAHLPALLRYRRTVAITPEWDDVLGEPYVKLFQVRIDGALQSVRIPRGYVYPAVQVATAALVADGTLASGDVFAYRVCAYASVDEPAVSVPVASHTARRGRTVGHTEQPIPLAYRELSALVHVSTQHFPDAAEGNEAAVDCDVPVFFHEQVLSDARELARSAGELEHAGFLLGHVRRDSASAELMVEVTALVEAKGTQSERAQVTFKPETWDAARAAVTLRGQGELLVGWVHNHPFFCAGCDEARRAQCVFRKPFFSEQDRAVHHTSFGGAFQIALLVSDLGAAEFSYNVFGWRDGAVVHRPYRVLRGAVPNPTAAPAPHALSYDLNPAR